MNLPALRAHALAPLAMAVTVAAIAVSAAALVGTLFSVAIAARVEPLDPPIPTQTLTFLVDDVADIGFACDLISTVYAYTATGWNMTVHAMNCSAERVFASGFDR